MHASWHAAAICRTMIRACDFSDCDCVLDDGGDGDKAMDMVENIACIVVSVKKKILHVSI